MNFLATPQPFMALVDDDAHSARLMTRMLLAHGAPSVRWLEGASIGEAQLREWVAAGACEQPGLVIVDLKSSSTATVEFIFTIRELDGAEELLVAAIAPTLERQTREILLEAGADAVFERHGEIGAYRREAESIVSFWVRNQRLDATGS